MFQDVDGKLRDFQDKQNIDIGLIMGRGGSHQASLAPDSMPVIPRASGMRMGATRSLSVSKFPCLTCSFLALGSAAGNAC